MSKTLNTVLFGVALIAVLLFIFANPLGLRESRQETKSRLIHEEHERRMQRSDEESARVRRELEDAQRLQQRLWEDHERLQRKAIEGR